MSLIKRNPLRRNELIFPNVSTIIERFFDDDYLRWPTTSSSSIPAVNIKDTKDAFKVEVAAPGLKKEDFKIDLENNVLTISAEKEENKEEGEEKFRRQEFSYTSFVRSFQLSENEVDAEKISAKYENGVLQIEIPKKEEAKKKAPKKIDIA